MPSMAYNETKVPGHEYAQRKEGKRIQAQLYTKMK